MLIHEQTFVLETSINIYTSTTWALPTYLHQFIIQYLSNTKKESKKTLHSSTSCDRKHLFNVNTHHWISSVLG